MMFSYTGVSMFAAAAATHTLLASFSKRTRGVAAPLLRLASTGGEGLGEANKRTRKSPIYTRTGDAGTSSLYNGERRSKTDMVFHALGNQDELNATIGVACEHCVVANNRLSDMLIEIQSRIFELGAAVATPLPSSTDEKIRYTTFPDAHTKKLESWIDKLDSELPPLKTFILPSGGLSAAQLHLARTVCRRAERSVVPLVSDGLVDAEVGRYLNRLSDFLFVAARAAAHRGGFEELAWKKSS